MIRKVLQLILILSLIFIVGWILYQASTILLYVLVGAIVALIGRPLSNLLEKIKIKGRKLPNALISAFTLIIIIGVLALVIGAFLPVVIGQFQQLSKIDLDLFQEKLQPYIEGFNKFIVRYHINPDMKIDINEILNYIFNSLNFTLLSGFLNTAIGVFGNILIAIFSISFISFFFLKDKNTIRKLVLAITPLRMEKAVDQIFVNTNNTLSRYFLGLLVQILAITTCVYIGLSIVGVKNALLIATFSGIANLIPYLGPWIGASFGAFILLANNIAYSFSDVVGPKMLGLVLVFAITQLLDNYLFQPAIFANSIKAHPLEIFLVILIAGSIGGILGMVVALPVYSFLRIVFTEMNREFSWLKSIKSGNQP